MMGAKSATTTQKRIIASPIIPTQLSRKFT